MNAVDNEGDGFFAQGSGGIFQQDHKLISAQAGGSIADAQALLQALGDHHEQIITNGMPHAVIDGFELVNVQEQDGISNLIIGL
ncbi:hypothetical protein SDC9_111371 [bioreactor metagenome]|uniref:Uncharacterized protein n=1 Tax=bioreactor metagenome TaxID=1076179 RepID=A0A645BRQ1_9ZZZZ